MWFSKILNPERSRKEIKGNRETFGFKADMLIIYNFFFTKSLSVYSELLTAFQDQVLNRTPLFPVIQYSKEKPESLAPVYQFIKPVVQRQSIFALMYALLFRYSNAA